ncbi:MAG TPA: hypothetical protein VMR18_02910 [Candidatus Saccharimonadales bacterium]|jgi:hypothetical protein|nr:hypothetical protein [Candidatus Saccharimonadales bacterium]
MVKGLDTLPEGAFSAEEKLPVTPLEAVEYLTSRFLIEHGFTPEQLAGVRSVKLWGGTAVEDVSVLLELPGNKVTLEDSPKSGSHRTGSGEYFFVLPDGRLNDGKPSPDGQLNTRRQIIGTDGRYLSPCTAGEEARFVDIIRTALLYETAVEILSRIETKDRM